MSENGEESEQILNLCAGGAAFPDAPGDNEAVGGGKKNLIHIRIQQRNGKKAVTTVQGIPQDFDLKKLIRHFRKEFACNGTVLQHQEYGEVLRLSGDQRDNAAKFLVNVLKIPEDNIKKHGF